MTRKENIIKMLEEYGIILNQEFYIDDDPTIYKIDENLNVFKKEDDEFIPLINSRSFIYDLLINDNYTIVPTVILNDIEKAILPMLLNNDFKYIVRDKDGRLFAYKYLPQKSTNFWMINDFEENNFILNNDLFNFIKWEDKNAVVIKSLIRT